MDSETSLNKKQENKKSFPWFRVAFTIVLVGIMTRVGLHYYFTFKDLDERYYASVFYSWRTQYANKAMCDEVWNVFDERQYDKGNDKDEFANYVKFAQEEFHLFDNCCNHYPFSPKFHHELADSEHCKKFDVFRKFMTETCNIELTDDMKSGKVVLNPKQAYWWGYTTDKDVKARKLLDAKELTKIETDIKEELTNNEYIRGLSKAVSDFYNKYKDRKNLTYENGVAKDAADDLNKLYDASKIDEDLDNLDQKKRDKAKQKAADMIKNVPRDMGRALAPVETTFFYSRIVYLIYFLTLNCEIDNTKCTETANTEEEKKLADEIKRQSKDLNARFLTVARCFDQVFINIYEKDVHEYANQKNGFYGVAKKWLGIDSPTFLSEGENIEAIGEKLEEMTKVTQKVE